MYTQTINTPHKCNTTLETRKVIIETKIPTEGTPDVLTDIMQLDSNPYDWFTLEQLKSITDESTYRHVKKIKLELSVLYSAGILEQKVTELKCTKYRINPLFTIKL